MITYLVKNNDTATLRIVSTEESKVQAALCCGDRVNLDSAIKEINDDPSIQHVDVCVTYYDDEKKIVDAINNIPSKNTNTQLQNSSKREKCKDDVKKDSKHNHRCEICGSEEALFDKNGKKYPCYSCIQIDTGKRVIDAIGNKFENSISKNNKLIEELLNFLIKGSRI